jgi:hypothetical protein
MPRVELVQTPSPSLKTKEMLGTPELTHHSYELSDLML